MAIKQYDKIVAQEINNNASTSFSQGALVYATDIANLYGGSDTIARGVLIRAEHFANLGLPGSGGLNGTFNGMSFKDADNNPSISGFDYVKDNNGWTLYITKGGTINFTNFGIKGSTVDIFMIGGGGAGNKDGGNGGGGQPITKPRISLSTNRSYTLTIGAGATSNGGNGGETYTTILSDRASGGKGGVSGSYTHIVANMEGSYANNDYIYMYPSLSCDREDMDSVPADSRISFQCDSAGNYITSTDLVISGQSYTGVVYRGTNGWWYRGGAIYNETKIRGAGSNGSQWIDLTYCFGNSSWWQVGGLGPNPTSTSTSGQHGTRYGQGGGGNYNKAYGGSSYGHGANGIIAIRNWR